jgi:hypothetical protein
VPDEIDEIDEVRHALQTPRAAAIAGIAFAVMLGVSIALMRASIPAEPSDAGEWLTDAGRRRAFSLALNLIPFAGIAFLWFIGVVRTRIGDAEDRFFASVFLGSGLLFLAMLFATAAIAGGIVETGSAASGSPDPEVWEFGRRTTYTLTNVYAMRMAAVFIISTTTIGLRVAILPRWLVVFGFASAVLLLIGSSAVPWLTMAFPTWVLVLSAHILVTDLRSGAGEDGLSARRPRTDGTD